MEFIGVEWADSARGYFVWIIDHAGTTLDSHWRRLVELPSHYPQLLSPQTLFGLVGLVLGLWKWWEGREANLFKRFESMIERNEAQLVKARSDVLDLLNRPGPGLLIRAPMFTEKPLRIILARRKWNPAFSLLPLAQAINSKLENAIHTCDHKVSAHLGRLAFFREQIASARLIQGALAAGRGASAREEHDRHILDQEALDHFRAVLALPGHQEDLAALELMAHQLVRLNGQAQSAINAYLTVIGILQGQQESRSRNLLFSRAKRGLAILRYPSAPGVALGLLAQANTLLTELAPPRDRDLLELAETAHLEGIARLRLSMNVQGPTCLSQAQGHYRDSIRSLRSRRRGLFRWILRERRLSGNRVAELRCRAEEGLAHVDHLIKLNDKHQALLIASLVRGNGVPRHNRRPLRLRQSR
jgi:hypothetical protein